MNKPITILIEEYKKNLTDLINNSELPAWLIILLTDPLMDQVKFLADKQAKEDKQNYELSLTKEETTKEEE